MSRQKHTLEQKVEAINAIQLGKSYAAVSDEYEVTVRTLQRWYEQRDSLRREFREQVTLETDTMILQARRDIAERTVALIKAIDDERILKAPLNQLSSALGVLVDRFLKLRDTEIEIDTLEEDTAEQVIRIEYYDASTGEVSAAPPWARDNPESSGAIQGGRVWEALRQDDDGSGYHNGKSHSWDEGLVAGTDLSNGESGLARFEDDDDERDWYHD